MSHGPTGEDTAWFTTPQDQLALDGLHKRSIALRGPDHSQSSLRQLYEGSWSPRGGSRDPS